MDTKRVVGGFLVAVVFAACLTCGGCEGGSSAGHWEGGGVSLDWPEGWRLEPDTVGRSSYLEVLLDPSVLCELSRKEPYARVVLMERDLASGETVQGVFDETYEALAETHGSSLREVTGWSTTVSGQPALVKSYEAPSGEPYYQYEDVWLERDGRIYVLSVWAHISVDEQEIPVDFAEILESLDVGSSQ